MPAAACCLLLISFHHDIRNQKTFRFNGESISLFWLGSSFLYRRILLWLSYCECQRRQNFELSIFSYSCEYLDVKVSRPQKNCGNEKSLNFFHIWKSQIHCYTNDFLQFLRENLLLFLRLNNNNNRIVHIYISYL